MSDVHDVAVVGAGPGGSAAAYFLVRRGLDVLLLDKSGFPRDKACGDGLSPHALKVLKDMDILDDVIRAGQRITGLEVYSPKGYSVSAQVPPLERLPPYGLIVPRLTLDNILRERAIAASVEYQSPSRTNTFNIGCL